LVQPPRELHELCAVSQNTLVWGEKFNKSSSVAASAKPKLSQAEGIGKIGDPQRYSPVIIGIFSSTHIFLFRTPLLANVFTAKMV